MQQEDKRLNEAFHDAYKDIKASEDLKKETLKMMLLKEEDSLQEPEKRRKKRFSVRYYGIAAAVICVMILAVGILRPTGISYVTMMEDGVFYDEVELENGVIRFLTNRVVISTSPNAGQAGFMEDAVSGMTDEKQSEPGEQEETKNGGRLQLFKADTLKIPRIREEEWSYIDGQKIYVFVLEMDGMRFHAIYEKEDGVYEVIGENVTQKEFIDYLYKKINRVR